MPALPDEVAQALQRQQDATQQLMATLRAQILKHCQADEPQLEAVRLAAVHYSGGFSYTWTDAKIQLQGQGMEPAPDELVIAWEGDDELMSMIDLLSQQMDEAKPLIIRADHLT